MVGLNTRGINMIANKKYLEFVNSLIKPGEQLLLEWDAKKASIIHATLGIACELLELDDAIDSCDGTTSSRENVVEEYGDVLFFSSVLVHELYGVNAVSLVEGYLKDVRALEIGASRSISEFFHESRVDFTQLSETVLSKLKAYLFYNKEEAAGQFLQEDIARLLLGYACLSCETVVGGRFSNQMFWSFVERCKQHNFNKLSQRYPEGVFSNESAKERKDKLQ